MLNDVVRIKIISKKDLKVGDKVLFGEHIVEVTSVSFDKWRFKNDYIGELEIPIYHTYYKIEK
jgi:hypothetical protein